MDAGEAAAAGLEHATGLCNRLYNFFARHFGSSPAASASTAGTVRITRDVPIGDAAAGRPTNINERSDAFIRSRKEALRLETARSRRPRQ